MPLGCLQKDHTHACIHLVHPYLSVFALLNFVTEGWDIAFLKVTDESFCCSTGRVERDYDRSEDGKSYCNHLHCSWKVSCMTLTSGIEKPLVERPWKVGAPVFRKAPSESSIISARICLSVGQGNCVIEWVVGAQAGTNDVKLLEF